MSIILDIMSMINYITGEGSDMKLKNRLRVLRAEKEISQKDLADELDLSRQTINSIERGKFNPSIMTALKIAEFFKVPVDEVFKLEEDE